MAVEYKDYYKILGVGKGADAKAIKQAYRRLAQKYHPDKNPRKDAAERFREVNEAYEVLSDPEKRQRYDALGADWQRYAREGFAGFRPGAQRDFGGFRVHFGGGRAGTADLGDFSDFFKTFFGDLGFRADPFQETGPFTEAGPFTRARPWRGRGEDVETPIEVTLEEAYRGTRRTFELQIEEPCGGCGGTGIQGREACRACSGTGAVPRHRRIEVKIPPRVRDGSRVRVAGEGGAGSGGDARGDLYLLVKVAPHPIFERRDDDLHCEVPISVSEATLGAEIEVPTLRGKVSMKVPPETSSGKTFRLPGYGMPRLRGEGHGDAYVRVRVVVPQGLTARERELFAELGRLRPENPRASRRSS